VKDEDAALRLAVKEYQPRSAPNSTSESVTIIGLHGNGFPKVSIIHSIYYKAMNSSYPGMFRALMG
jgi:hypothetical protein